MTRIELHHLRRQRWWRAMGIIWFAVMVVFPSTAYAVQVTAH